MIRVDNNDVVYRSERGKLRAVVEDIKQSHEKGQPVLVGTTTIEKSEALSELLKREGIKHEVLNAKYHEKEAEIVAQAGKFGAVTIATNMAGRGTDIMLGGNTEALAKHELKKRGYTEDAIMNAVSLNETNDPEIIALRKEYKSIYDKLDEKVREDRNKVIAAGGLKIVGTERHESRRIDNQLRGRSGRQGDVGESRFYISLEDNLMKLFGSDRIQTMAAMLNMPEDMPLEMKMLTSTIENAQKNVEAIHFANRKRILQYDDIMNEQRHIIYTERRQVLDGQNMRDKVISMIRKCVDATIDSYYGQEHVVSDKGAFENYVRQTFDVEFVAKDEKPDTLKEELYNLVLNRYEEKEKEIGDDHIRELERVVILRNVDTKWMDHIDCMEQLKEGIQLRGYGQTDPVVAFRYESYEVFNEMTDSIAESVVKTMLHLVPQEKVDRVQIVRNMMTNLNQAQKAGTEKAKPKTNAPGQKVGRNEPCPCGSGKKYKHCCGK